MAKTNEKVMALVEEELKKNADASVDELYEKAKAAHPSIRELTLRQFNARYPLQVKRRRSRGKPRKKKAPARRASRSRSAGSKKEGPDRERVRATFLRFASDLVAAEERKQLVDVVAGVDRYVDEVLDVAGKG